MYYSGIPSTRARINNVSSKSICKDENKTSRERKNRCRCSRSNIDYENITRTRRTSNNHLKKNLLKNICQITNTFVQCMHSSGVFFFKLQNHFFQWMFLWNKANVVI